MTPAKLAAARQMLAARDLSVEAIAKVLGVSRSSLYRGLRRSEASSSGASAAPKP